MTRERLNILYFPYTQFGKRFVLCATDNHTSVWNQFQKLRSLWEPHATNLKFDPYVKGKDYHEFPSEFKTRREADR